MEEGRGNRGEREMSKLREIQGDWEKYLFKNVCNNHQSEIPGNTIQHTSSLSHTHTVKNILTNVETKK